MALRTWLPLALPTCPRGFCDLLQAGHHSREVGSWVTASSAWLCRQAPALPQCSGSALSGPLAPPPAQDRPAPYHQGGGSSQSPLVQFEIEVCPILETR